LTQPVSATVKEASKQVEKLLSTKKTTDQAESPSLLKQASTFVSNFFATVTETKPDESKPNRARGSSCCPW
ncbi:MAG: hypothetical protein ACK4PR_11045, partial [Gammaproteobacteria bacterium]